MKPNYGKISIKPGSDVAKLITQLGSKNKSESLAASEAIAAFFGPVIQQVVDQAPVVSNLYQADTYLEGTAPSLPLDIFYDVKDRNFINVWTQSIAGGLATSEVKGLDELFLSVYSLDTAVSMKKKYAREARVAVVAAILNRVAQEILVKQEINGANILLKAVADATYDADDDGVAETRQVIRSTTADVLQMDDWNRLATLAARTKPSWFGGTPVGGMQTFTHILFSPEMAEQVRSMSYNPQNTRGVPNSDESTVLAAPDSIRNAVWNMAGVSNFLGSEIMVLSELGVGKRYNKVFAKYAGSTQYGGSAFTQASQEIVVALNLAGTNPLVKLSEANAEGQTFNLVPDDQFPNRSDTVGFYGSVTEGRAILDSRGILGLIV
jgi:hypothetical protein